MAVNATVEDYGKSGFQEAAGTEGLKTVQTSLPTTEDALTQQAKAQYEDTYKALDESLSKQFASIVTSQAADDKLLNEQYNTSVSSMMAKLQKRGLATGGLPQAQTNALNQHMNDVKATRALIYQGQQRAVEGQRELLRSDYDKAINQRIAANRQFQVQTAADLAQKIAELTSASWNDYVKALLAKKSGGGGGGGSRSSGSSGGGNDPKSYVDPKDLKGDDNYYVSDPTGHGIDRLSAAQLKAQQKK